MADVSTLVTTGVALVTAVVVLLDRLFDIRRHAKGHEAQIAAKDETIKVLRERLEAQQQMNPPKLREHLDAIVDIMQKHGDTLSQELEAARSRIAELESHIRDSEALSRDPELLRLASATIAHLSVAERDSFVLPRFLLSRASEDAIQTLRASLDLYLAASSALAAKHEGPAEEGKGEDAAEGAHAE